jgi:hypothetical protein
MVSKRTHDQQFIHLPDVNLAFAAKLKLSKAFRTLALNGNQQHGHSQACIWSDHLGPCRALDYLATGIA